MAADLNYVSTDQQQRARDDLHRYLGVLVGQSGSDLHVKAGTKPKIRVDGALRALSDEADLTAADTAAMAAVVMRPEVARHFEENNEADCAYSVPGLARFRVNVYRQRGSVGIVMRLVRTSAFSFEELGLPPAVQQLADEQRGLILVTGPTGSGKTTTLAAMIDHINATRECNIVTIEDPLEYLHNDKMASISQREVGFDTRSFAAAMRGAMRQDPDVILVGEMRDQETVEAALAAAETGHLVLSTLHTIDAPETINRIVDFFPAYQQNQIRVTLSGSLRGTVCQRLVPRADTSGRAAVVEIMVVNGRIQNCILDKAKTGDIAEIIKDGDYYGMQSFDQALVGLIEDGVVNFRDALMAASNPHDLKVMLQQRGLVAAGAR
ncbi:MAG TPA: PilT/PilU family type 4a pilus ATPase [Acidimicrobiales bacterium]|nr:PilT/PilU family type 4a pilus ATPase [Acidimicrobiales bacterium]